MKSIIASLSLVSLAAAASCPITGAATTKDMQILNFALTLEYLESAFYTEGLNKYDDAAFTNAGYPPWVRRRFVEISQHEAAHVATLQAALGDQAVQPCTYTFPYSTPQSFIALSMVLESVGVSAYVGAASQITDPAYLDTAASILTTEARHNAWVSSAVRKQAAWGGAFDTALSMNQVYSIASAFMSSCPTTNALSVQSFPPLSIENCTYEPGSTVDVSYDVNDDDPPHYLALFHGEAPTFVPLSCDSQAELPFGLSGIVYVVVTTSSEGTLADVAIVAGPALLFFPDSD